MAVKERSQIKGTDAQIKAFAGHNGVLAFATDTKSLHVLSGTAGTTTEFLPSNKVATKTELANYTPTSSLATVATSGSYNDLSDKPVVDSALSSTSENPVQNKVINSALDGKLSTSGGTVNGSITFDGGNYLGLVRGSGVRDFEIIGADNDGCISIVPGNGGSFAGKKSASLYLTSTDYTGATIGVGSFALSAMNATTGNKTLLGFPDGSLTWCGHNVISVVAESYGDNSWYRKYSDGWIEQGGYSTGGIYTSPATLTFPMAFSSAQYTIVGTGCQDNVGHHSINIHFKNRTRTSVKAVSAVNGAVDESRNFTWYACGK